MTQSWRRGNRPLIPSGSPRPDSALNQRPAGPWKTPSPVQRQPRYLLEYLGAEDGGTWHRFRMTARGYGAEEGLEVTVQRTLGLTLP